MDKLIKTRLYGNFTYYVTVKQKFLISHLFAFSWLIFSIFISLHWVKELSLMISWPVSLFIIGGLAYIPGYLNAFMIISLILDKQPAFKNHILPKNICILIAAKNEAIKIGNTLSFIAKQDFSGEIKIIIVDNGSEDNTFLIAKKEGKRLGLNVEVIKEKNPGKHHALNTGLKYVNTEYMITLDADTLLHKSAVSYLVNRMQSALPNVAAVAGSILVRNSRDNLITRIQEWDYYLGIASIKRLQGLYQGTLVTQGAYSIYKTEIIKTVGGWPDAIGEDIVLTWSLLKNGYRTYFEPLAVAFTDVPNTYPNLIRQRSRWARGMIEALKRVKPWHLPLAYTKYLTGINLILPYLDIVFTFFWIPGLFLALSFKIYWIVGPMTILVIPLTLLSYIILYQYQKHVFKQLDLKVRKNISGFIIFLLCYQIFLSPISILGYIQELIKLKRNW